MKIRKTYNLLEKEWNKNHPEENVKKPINQLTDYELDEAIENKLYSRSIERCNPYTLEKERKKRRKGIQKLHCTFDEKDGFISIKVLKKEKGWNKKEYWCELIHWCFWKKHGKTFKLRLIKGNIIKIYQGRNVYKLERDSKLEELYENLHSHLSNPCVRNGWNKKHHLHIELTFYDFFLICSKGFSKSARRKGDFLNKRLLNGGKSAIELGEEIDKKYGLNKKSKEVEEQ